MSIVTPILAVVGAGYLVATAGILISVMRADTPEITLAMLPAVLLVVVVVVWLARRIALRRQPYTRSLALLVRRRDVVVDKSEGKYRHFVTLGAPNGARRELRMMPKLANATAHGGPAIVAGTYGVAHVRGEWLVGFERA